MTDQAKIVAVTARLTGRPMIVVKRALGGRGYIVGDATGAWAATFGEYVLALEAAHRWASWTSGTTVTDCTKT